MARCPRLAGLGHRRRLAELGLDGCRETVGGREHLLGLLAMIKPRASCGLQTGWRTSAVQAMAQNRHVKALTYY